MNFPRLLPLIASFVFGAPSFALAGPVNLAAKDLVPHEAVYDIKLVATHSGSQIINISGQMTYEWKPACDAWQTDHKFKLTYQYADSPGMSVTSDFSTYETQDGKDLDFTSRRTRDKQLYQEIRGHARLDDKKAGQAIYTLPADLKYDLAEGSLFPTGHTVELLRRAQEGQKFYVASVFDGSDEEGPIQISSFIGRNIDGDAAYAGNKKIDHGLLKGQAWNVRMAVFPEKNREEESDYEMDMVFHKNGIISDMLIEYDDFSVRQKLVSLKAISADSCGSPPIPRR